MLSIIVQLIFIFLFTRQILIAAIAIWTYITGDAPFRSTERSVIKDLVNQYKVPSQTIYELGSGSGSATFALAKYLPNKFVSVERNMILHLITNIKKFFRFDKHRFNFVRTNLFDVDLSRAMLVYFYMSDGANRKIRPKFEKELSKGAILMILRFKFKSKKFKLIKTIQTKYPLFIYEKID